MSRTLGTLALTATLALFGCRKSGEGSKPQTKTITTESGEKVTLKIDSGVNTDTMTITIGALNDQSGPAAAIGKPFALGKSILAKQVNAGLGHVFGMRNLVNIKLQHLPARISQHITESLVHAQERSVGTGMNQAYRGMLKRRPKPSVAVAHRLVRPLATLKLEAESLCLAMNSSAEHSVPCHGDSHRQPRQAAGRQNHDPEHHAEIERFGLDQPQADPFSVDVGALLIGDPGHRLG